MEHAIQRTPGLNAFAVELRIIARWLRAAFAEEKRRAWIRSEVDGDLRSSNSVDSELELKSFQFIHVEHYHCVVSRNYV